MDVFLKSHDIVSEVSSSCGDHSFDFGVLAQILDDLGGLEGKFSGWEKDEGLNMLLLLIDHINHWDNKTGCLSGSVLGSGDHVLV